MAHFAVHDGTAAAELLEQLADAPDHVEPYPFDDVAEFAAEVVKSGTLDHTAAVVLVARITREPVWVLVGDEHEGHAQAHDLGLDRRLVRCLMPRDLRQRLRGHRIRLWLIGERFLDHPQGPDAFADLRHLTALTRNPLCH